MSVHAVKRSPRAVRRAPSLSLLFTACAVGLPAAPVLAGIDNGFGVATAARARNAYSLDAAEAAFRMTGDSSGNYTRPSDVPSVMNQGCNYDPAQNVSCAGSATGTSGTDYNLTASHSSASLSDDVGSVPGSRDAAGTGQARANLATGELASSAVSNNWRDYRGALTAIGAQGWAHMNDTLTFNVAAAAPGTSTEIGVELILNGTLGVTDLRGSAIVTSDLYFGSASASHFAFTGSGTRDVTQSRRDAGWVSSSWVVGEDGNFRFTGVYALTGPSETLGFSQFLFTTAGGGASSLFGSTSHFALNLPSNVTYTSASGVFLTSAVPEPATTLLWALGLGGVGLLARRRRTAGGTASLQSAHEGRAAPAHCP